MTVALLIMLDEYCWLR